MAKLLIFAALAHSAVGAKGPTCSSESQHKYCFKNSLNIIGTTHADLTAAECCALCASESKCQSYTSWGTGGPGKSCNIFSTIGDRDGGSGTSCVSGQAQRMNIVFMFQDTLRAESFSSYGNPLQTTPNLDEFAKTGVRFDQTHAMHTQCSPSRVTMLTGRHMHVLGHRTQMHLIQPYEFNYFQILKQRIPRSVLW